MADRWWRAYDRSRRDPKLQRLPAETFRGWYNLVCLASEHGGNLPSIADTAFELRKTEEATSKLLGTLESAELFERRDGVWSPRKWNTLQYKSDVSTDRVREFRERQRNVSETPSESETEADTEKTPAKAGERVSAPPAKRATRLPPNWRPDDAGRSFAADCGLDPDSTADAFADYWTAASGRTSAKLDWNAAFRTWCRRDSTGRVGPAAARPVQPARGGGAYLDQLAIIASRDDADERDRH
jgi:hypothetical protein